MKEERAAAKEIGVELGSFASTERFTRTWNSWC